jgi:acetylaranotin biosynthesis cluster protein L
MIYVTNAVPVNESGEPALTRGDVWAGLEKKALNALPFVPAMTHCEVLDRRGDREFDREIEFRGQRFTERITLEPESRVTFTRIAGDVLGTIANEIEEDESGDLSLRFSFALLLKGVEPGSAEEAEYAEGMKGDYLKAVEATLAAIRRVARGEAVGV